MKYYSWLIFLILLVITACEDNKKSSEQKVGSDVTQPVEEKYRDTVAATTKEVVKPELNGNEYPKLTNENVVEFLTEYGKENPETRVKVITTFGDIEIKLYEDTPLHRANFIYLVKQEYFYGSFFHRVVPNFIIQGGNSDNRKTGEKRSRIGKDYLLPAEIIPGRIHEYGTVSGAKQYRENPDKRTAPFEFFIFHGPKAATGHLNGNYTIFGRVTKGMSVVKQISELPADEGDWPLENVYIDVQLAE